MVSTAIGLRDVRRFDHLEAVVAQEVSHVEANEHLVLHHEDGTQSVRHGDVDDVQSPHGPKPRGGPRVPRFFSHE